MSKSLIFTYQKLRHIFRNYSRDRDKKFQSESGFTIFFLFCNSETIGETLEKVELSDGSHVFVTFGASVSLQCLNSTYF